jgi:hypothetical protein
MFITSNYDGNINFDSANMLTSVRFVGLFG